MAAADQFKNRPKSFDSSSNLLFEITPHDTNELSYVTRCLYVGAPGNIAVQDTNGNDVLLSNAPAGLQLPIRIKRVYATGTTAGGLVGFV